MQQFAGNADAGQADLKLLAVGVLHVSGLHVREHNVIKQRAALEFLDERLQLRAAGRAVRRDGDLQFCG